MAKKAKAPAQAGSGDESAASSPAPKKRGRPDIYTEELGDIICELLADGQTLNAICTDNPGLPSERTIRTWALNPEHPFSPKYVRAREVGYHKMADDLLGVSDDGSADWVERKKENGETYYAVDHEHIQRSKLRVDTRKWLLAKALPKIYGDKIQHEGTGQDGAFVVEVVKFGERNAKN